MLCFENVHPINLRHLLTMVEQLIRLIVNSRTLLRPLRTSKLLDRPRLDHHKGTRPFSLLFFLFFNGFLQTPTDVLCVLNSQPTWAKITQTVHVKGQRAESKDQRADMCTDG